MFSDYLVGFPAFAKYFGAGLVYAIAFVAIYVQLTGWRELKLLREGNVAVAVAMVGATLGYILPMSRVIEASASYIDMALWSAIAFAVQGIALLLAKLAVKDITRRIESGDMAAAIAAAGISLGVGLISRAALTP